MLLCTRQKRMNLESTLEIKIDNDYLENSQSEKVLGVTINNQQNRITKLQKRAAPLILDADLSIPSSDLFKKLKWLPFPKYAEYQQAVTMYKSLNELNPHYMNKLFSYTQENHSYGTRNATSSLLTLPKCNKSIGQ